MIVVKQLGEQYSLLFTPWIAVGLVAFVGTAWHRLRGRRRTVVVAATILYLLANTTIRLTPIDVIGAGAPSVPGIGVPMRELFGARFPPATRSDYDTIARLVDYLRAEASVNDQVYVAASSDLLNDDLLWHANRAIHADVLTQTSDRFWESPELRIVHWVPFLDSSDPYPLPELLQSQFVVVATPFQSHLRPGEQRVIQVVEAMFADRWEFADDFAALPGQFTLSGGVQVRVYRRIRPTSLQTAVRTLRAMEVYVGRRPGGQSDWMAIDRSPESGISEDRHGPYHIAALFGPATSPQSFLYLDLHGDLSSLRGNIHVAGMHCGAITLHVEALDALGDTVDTATQLLEANGLSITLQTTRARYLVLTLAAIDATSDVSPSCRVDIDSLVLASVISDPKQG